jgi:radical SAM superfamily enzyme YgiQ (UPF0313 family)
MKIAFIETPSPWLIRKHVQIPLGPLYLSTILKNYGYDVSVIRPNNVDDLDSAMSFDVICFSGTTLEYPMNIECAKWIKSRDPHKKLILGGVHATALPEDVVKDGFFDAVFAGEAENHIVKLIQDVENNTLKSLYQTNELIQDLDTIPFPDRGLVPNSTGGDVFAYGKNYKGTGNQNFITTRGCPFNCAFCASKYVWKGKVRFRSVENIINEMKSLIKATQIRQLRICDDNVTSNPKRCYDLCRAIIDNKLDIVWRCSVRAESLTPEIAEIMKASGCREISPGIESGDQRVLDYLNKNTSLDAMSEGCENAQSAGLTIRALLMIGTPGERRDTPEINHVYLKKLKFDMITLSTFIPLPGTAVWRNPEKYNCTILSKDFRKYNKDYWVSIHGKAQKRTYEPLIQNHFMTLEQQIDNVRRMEEIVESFAKINKG